MCRCCGADEFIKLHAYTLTDFHRVVHLDADTLVLHPMDELMGERRRRRRRSVVCFCHSDVHDNARTIHRDRYPIASYSILYGSVMSLPLPKSMKITT